MSDAQTQQAHGRPGAHGRSAGGGPRRRVLAAVAAVALLPGLLLAGCGGSASSAAPGAQAKAGTAPAASPTPVQGAAGSNGSGPAASAGGATPSLGHFSFAIPISSGLQVLPVLAQQAGYFKRYGLDVSIRTLRGSVPTLAALTSGAVQMSAIDSPSTIQAHLSGADTVIIAVPVTKPIFDLIVPKSITQPAQLRGRTVAVTKITESDGFQIALALKAWGLTPQKNVTLVALGDFPSMFAALKAGHVAGAPLPPPFNFQAEAQGFHPLTNLQALPINYPTAVIQTTRQYAQSHPKQVLAFLKAYVDAIHLYRTNEPYVVKVYGSFLHSSNTALLQKTWSFYAGLMNPDPTPTAAGVQYVLQNLAQMGRADAAKADPKAFIDTSFMDQLKTSGFLSSLGSAAPAPETASAGAGTAGGA